MMAVKQAWFVVLGGFIFFMFQLGTQKTLGVFVPFFADDLGLSEQYVGTSCGIGVGLRLILAPIWAMIAESVSPRKVTFLGGLLTCLGFIVAGFVISMWGLTWSLLLAGIGLGLPYVSIPNIVRDYYPHGDGHDTAIGIIFIGSAIGMTVLPPIAEVLIEAYGWRSASMLLGAACLNISVGACFFKPRTTNVTFKNYESVKDQSKPNLSHLGTLSNWIGITAIMRRPMYIIYLFGFSLWGLAYSGWTLFSFSYAVSLDFSPRSASLFSAVGGIGTLFGRCLSIPFLHRQWASQYLQFVALSFGGGLMMVFYPFSRTYMTLLAVSFLTGVFIGSPPPVCVLITKDITDDIPECYSGALGLQYMSQGIGMLAGGPITGYIFNSKGSYDMAFYSLALAEFIAALISIVKTPEISDIYNLLRSKK